MRRLLAIAVLGGTAAVAQDAPPVHVARLDEVGLAGRTDTKGEGGGVYVVHRTLDPGSFAELTALDSGRTILAEVRGGASLPPDRVADLSPGAAAALALSDAPLTPVRIRPILPSPQEQTRLRGGNAVTRLDAPGALLVALRRRLPTVPRAAREMTRQAVAIPPAAVRPPTPAPVAIRPAPARQTPRPAPVATGNWFVQVAALSDAARADRLAKSVGGVVRRAGTLYRVQTGPFATRAAADTARATLARRGFGDARIVGRQD